MDHEQDNSWVRGMLLPGESLIWTGKPDKLRFFGPEELVSYLFGGVMIAFAVFIMLQLSRAEGGEGTPLFVFVFLSVWVLAVFLMTFGRSIVNYLRKRKTRYALTSRRVIADNGRERNSLELTNLPPMQVTRRSDGSGSIRFGDSVTTYRSRSAVRSYHSAELELLDLADVNQVEYRIRSAADQAASARSQS